MVDDTDAIAEQLALITKRLDDMDALNKEQHPLEGAKPWYESRGIWSAIIAMIAWIVQTISGHEISAGDQEFLTTNTLSIVNTVAQIAQPIAIIGAWFFRWKATEKISNLPLP